MTTNEVSLLNIPIPQYPKFPLRSSLINKDPVIWVHLLEGYIKLFEFLVDSEHCLKSLEVKSQQQLQQFLKVYLEEVSEEPSRTISLGSVNPQITSNSVVLRAYVFQFIKSFSVIRANLTAKSLWDFIKIYVEKNSTIVRGLIDGSFKSKFNDNKKSGKISSIDSVQRHLIDLLENQKISIQDLNTLYILLGQHISPQKATKISIDRNGINLSDAKIVNKKLNASLFAESFVSNRYIEALETLYDGSRGLKAKCIEKIMITSIISLSTSKVAKLATSLDIDNAESLKKCPLFSSIILSSSYKKLLPGLEERLPFLKSISFSDKAPSAIDETHIATLCELFPQLTRGQAQSVLRENDDDVEHVTNMLLSDFDLISSIPDEGQVESQFNEKSPTKSLDLTPLETERFARNAGRETILVGKKKTSLDEVTEDFKKLTLSAALRLIYDSDDDEPDDTYDDQENTTGVDEMIEDDDDINATNQRASSQVKSAKQGISGLRHTFTASEWALFDIFKTKGASQFDKTKRKSKERKELKEITNWSDEQIEGWFKMLMKSPRRFRALEEEFLYTGNPNRNPSKDRNPINTNEEKKDIADEEQNDKTSTSNQNSSKDHHPRHAHNRNGKNKKSNNKKALKMNDSRFN
ncbi:uncharacterized protein PRCAT00004423001 [Priceomyces carsonii]|uniref:uncharacterized protein n=1 Tax=Priceomyces carsonii TaxID=28549 RepID=UPI002ED8A0E8|nr:unnamed protein product [Priceomyces carsonii]